ncbi:MAG: hypothetical protein H6983_02410 [Ectothiorhodospiraceae bacterium]|nr:hypothetical protein [Ectothiorhodospiraceae bacterium]
MDERWLIDERPPLSEADVETIEWKLAESGPTLRGGHTPTLAISLHDLTVHDNRKWFGEADIRVDALVVTAPAPSGEADTAYRSQTARFPRVADGATLPLGDGGLLVFHGPARHFLDLQLTVSRDRDGTEDLSGLLADGLASDEGRSAIDALLGLTRLVQPVGAVTAAIAGAARLGDLAYRLLRTATGATIGLYRGAHLEHRDRFGIGAHPRPPRHAFRVNDLSFRYQVSVEE